MPIRFFQTLLAVGVLTSLVGCGGGTTSVQGTVTVDGKPLKSGTIMFIPESGPAGVGRIEDGKIVDVKTGKKSGAPKGVCTITVSASEPGPDAMTPGKSLIADKYSDPNTSKLTADTSTDIVLNLEPYKLVAAEGSGMPDLSNTPVGK